jgi:hypothetical protein
MFGVEDVVARIEHVGDRFAPVLTMQQSLT